MSVESSEPLPPPDEPHLSNCAKYIAQLEITTYCFYLALCRDTSAAGVELFKRMNNPAVGDTVLEITSLRRGRTVQGRFGVLIGMEGVTYRVRGPDGIAYSWDDCKFITGPDGIAYSWDDCKFITVPDSVNNWSGFWR